MNKNTKQMKAARAKAEEAVLNRILCWIAGGSVLEFFLLFLNRYLYHYVIGEFDITLALHTGIRYVAVGALACAVAALFWWNSARKSDKSAVLPGVLTLFMAGLSVGCFVTWFFGQKGLTLACVAVPVVVLLVVIFYLYQREFFLLSLLNACAGAVFFQLYRIREDGVLTWRRQEVHYGPAISAQALLLIVGLVVVILAASSLMFLARRRGGKLKLFGKTRQLFSADASALLVYICSALWVLCLIAAALLGATFSYYCIFAVAALELIAAVYYTVKLA